MAGSEKELEKKLLEAGNRLLKPPSSVDELLPLLDEVEDCLTRVEQSPSESMQNALSPSIKALVSDEFLRHEDPDVKVAVATCISEITRITAPEAPYDDDQMKEVFQLIVSSFEKLHDKSSRSYNKRALILETVAKVRSCVVMLDLECDALILEMFQHFLKSIRDYHPDIVFSSMETIMTLVLDESEDVSPELLLCILEVLKKDKEVEPLARKLGEVVIEKSAKKLKPYLAEMVKSSRISLDDYSNVVADVCQVKSGAAEPNVENDVSKVPAGQREAAQPTSAESVEVSKETLDVTAHSQEACPPTGEEAPKSVMSNGTAEKVVEDSLAVKDPSKGAEQDASNECGPTEEPSETKADTRDGVVVEKLEKPKSKPGKVNKRKGKKFKTNSSKKSLEPTKPVVTDSGKEVEIMPESREDDEKDVSGPPHDDTGADAATTTENEKESEVPDASPKTSENEAADVASPSPSGGVPDEIHSKRGVQEKKKDSLVQDDMPLSNLSSRKPAGGSSASESKSRKNAGKKGTSGTDKEKKSTAGPSDEAKKEDGTTSDLEAKSKKQSEKTVEASSNQSEDVKKKGQGKATSGKDVVETPKNKAKDTVSSPKSGTKSAKDESPVEISPKVNSKRKRTPVGGKASNTKEYGPELVGTRVKVWWPKDKQFYEGVVESFDPVKKKHKVSYNDGDIEVLNLKTQKWEIIEGESEPDKGHVSDDGSPDELSEMHEKKKAKTSSDSTKKQGKVDSSAKKPVGTSSNKSKATPSESSKKQVGKSDAKSKDDTGKNAAKSEQKSGKLKDLKASNKSTDNAPKSAGKSQDDDTGSLKTGSKSKQDAPKTGSKLKVQKSDKKPSLGGPIKLKISSPSKKTEDMEMSPEKAPKTAVKSKDDDIGLIKIIKTGTKSKPKAQKSEKKPNPGDSEKVKSGPSSKEAEDSETSPEPLKASENVKEKTSNPSKSQKTEKKSNVSGSAKVKTGSSSKETENEAISKEPEKLTKSQKSEGKNGSKKRKKR